jgi:hypothetical protein
MCLLSNANDYQPDACTRHQKRQRLMPPGFPWQPDERSLQRVVTVANFSYKLNVGPKMNFYVFRMIAISIIIRAHSPGG